MNTRKVNIIALIAALLALSACGTTGSQRLASSASQPILSAAQAQAMIRVEVRARVRADAVLVFAMAWTAQDQTSF